MKRFFLFIWVKKLIIIPAVLAAAVLGFIFLRGDEEIEHQFVIVQKQDVIHEVDVTGRVRPAESVNLSFESSGRISRINISVGDKVSAGQTLVQLESADLSTQLQEAEAVVRVEQAKLNDLLSGAKIEEIKVQEVKVQNAKISLIDKKEALINSIRDAYTKSDDAVRNKTDQIFDNPRSLNPILKFHPTNSQYEIDLETERPNIENILNSWKIDIDAINITSDIVTNAQNVKSNLNQVKLYLDKVALAVNNASPSQSITQTTIDAWKTDTSTARTNINTAITNLATADESMRLALSTLSLEESNLNLKISGATLEEIVAQEASLDRAVASANNIRVKISKTILRSPISGIITAQNAKIGEIAVANSIVVSIISASKFEVETNIAEVDIADVKISDGAQITLDAYGNDVIFGARVISVDPAETIIEGVATYKVKMQFLEDDSRIKSGMTANITILTDKREGVNAVPQRAVIDRNGVKIIRTIQKDLSIKEVSVRTGLRGSDGNIEIIEGVNEGDRVITFFKE
ncbi:MAG: hypothetical protein COU46_01105 [Candidatus Niyogibacteria bacterium CG10_big_fil_rev_8_21_14_0_10_42_19]|uniref:Membrane fusion protein biotin-lipoyl like domain-containing protein n=1 Tax=Candidatus Niyogibacteria bacterium CG10_big_fil_rev_8_21_14_0_10_42_19 TaxID=1974725 RepID=A0A2H0TG32_9BACT|nr:MAG: hypothetical protein COU46_01105 [Candidatus Niyogibacteria bacterium CG10_big_fil_rev_8_21_14_0_10_42_19]